MKAHNINTDTPLVPYLIAEKVMDRKVKIEVYNRIGSLLVERAERHYADSEHFRKQINNPRKDCRKVLAMFMDHWLQAELTNTKN